MVGTTERPTTVLKVEVAAGMKVFSRPMLWTNNLMWTGTGILIGYLLAYGRWDYVLLLLGVEIALQLGVDFGRALVDSAYRRP